MNHRDDNNEIIIIKRVIAEDGGHHGGAWKIAFADFMTAMMALFLVLWLVNAANEKTKKSVASYFNPVKLVDRTRSARGLDDATTSDKPIIEVPEGPGTADKENLEFSEVNVSADEALFKDPFKILDGIAVEEIKKIEDSGVLLAEDYVSKALEDDAFNDPFSQPASRPADVNKNASEPVVGVPESKERSLAEEEKNSKSANEGGGRESLAELKEEKIEQLKEGMEDKVALSKSSDREGRLEKIASKLREEIKLQLAKVMGRDEKISESLNVEVTKNGVLISITDQYEFSMFQLGSAVPKGEIVLAMRAISDILSKRLGNVRVYGHTDARPYNSNGYDNWRLSTARAHSARLMLARGGLREKRVSQVVGFADRNLRDTANPASNTNRRIEILLEVS